MRARLSLLSQSDRDLVPRPHALAYGAVTEPLVGLAGPHRGRARDLPELVRAAERFSNGLMRRRPQGYVRVLQPALEGRPRRRSDLGAVPSRRASSRFPVYCPHSAVLRASNPAQNLTGPGAF